MKLTLGGDLMCGRSFNSMLEKNPNWNVWGNTLQHIQNADIFGVNLETSITYSLDAWPDKAFNYKLAPNLANLVLYPVDYTSLANNHILDYGIKGARETEETLDALRICYTGLKKSPPCIIGDIGFISATDHPKEWKDHVNYLQKSILSQVKQLRKTVSTVVVSLHWGPNWEDYISTEKQRIAYDLLHNGVDIIHGHSAHHVQRAEEMNGGVVFYSFGDLLDDYAVDSHYRNDLGFLADLTLKNSKIVDVNIYPTKITHKTIDDTLMARVDFAKGKDAKWVRDKLQNYM